MIYNHIRLWIDKDRCLYASRKIRLHVIIIVLIIEATVFWFVHSMPNQPLLPTYLFYPNHDVQERPTFFSFLTFRRQAALTTCLFFESARRLSGLANRVKSVFAFFCIFLLTGPALGFFAIPCAEDPAYRGDLPPCQTDFSLFLHFFPKRKKVT